MSWIMRKIKSGFRCLKEHGFVYTMQLLLKKIKLKVIKGTTANFDRVNKLFRSLAKKLNEGFIEIIKVNVYKNDPFFGHVYYIYFFGRQVYPGKRKIYVNQWANPLQPPMYFKVNRVTDFTKPCVQHWVNIAYQMKADYFIICDNKQMEYLLLRSVSFPSSEIKFISSIRKPLKKVCQTLCTPFWENATYAHLTPFYHSNDKKFWAIDADDTMLCLKHRRVGEALKKTQNMVDKEGISAISLDMWRTRSYGKQWSWGVAYINDNIDFCSIFENNKDLSWTTHYLDCDYRFNLDWFFTYLKDFKKQKIETFYIDNSYFIHWGNFFRGPTTWHICLWSKGFLTYLILKYVFCDENNQDISVLKIPEDCRKISINVLEYEGKRFLETEVTTLRNTPKQVRDLRRLENFGMDSIERL